MIKPSRSIATLAGILFWVGQGLISRAENWPQFRGPTGLGYTGDLNLPVKWGGPARENILWQAPLEGQGHASPIVWGDSIFVCTAFWPPDLAASEREKVLPEHHVTHYETSGGKLFWDVLVPPGPWVRNDFRSGPGGGYAAPTPATDGKRVYCAFGSSVVAALDFDGNIVWRKEMIPYTFDVTVGSSPILYGETVILFCAMAKAGDSRVIALNKSNGELKWTQPFPDMGFGHSTPIIIQANGQSQMLVLASGMSVAGNALRSLNPADGKLLWWCEGAGDAASPAYGSGLIYFDNGRGGPGVAVDPRGSGDLSRTHIRWKVNQVPEGIGSPIIVGGRVYRLHTPGVLKCWEIATGKLQYSERLEGLSSTWASPIADPHGRLFFANAGKSYVLQTGPEFRVLAINDLGDGNHPSPAVAGGRLYLVGVKNLYCIANTNAAPRPAIDTSNSQTQEARLALEKLGARIFQDKTSGAIVEVNLNRNGRVSDDDLRWVAAFPDLTDLSLENTKVDDEGLKHLGGLQRLGWLNLYRTEISDAGVKHLVALTNLQHLPVGETRITDEGLKSVAGMSSLVYLGLRRDAVTDAGLRMVRNLTNLTGLHLGETKITDAGLTNLCPLRHLRKLWLNDTLISDASLETLISLQELEELHLERAGISKAGLAALRKALPRCEIKAEPE